jgi:hypothetical protein
MVDWKRLYRVGGIAALLAVGVGLIETGITFLPAARSADAVTAVDWFTLFQSQPFMALRNLGLLNMFFNLTAIPAYLALYAALRGTNHSLAALATVTAYIGIAIFFGTNRALPMLDLSHRYTAATTDAARASLVAAGEAMLSVGQSHVPGTFPAFFFAEAAGIVISVAMLQSSVFAPLNAYPGIVGFALLMVSEGLMSFIPAWDNLGLILAMLAGLLSMAWYVLTAFRLLRLGRAGAEDAVHHSS